MSLEHHDIWAQDVEPLIIEQYKNSENLKGVIKAFCDELTEIDGTAIELCNFFDIVHAHGEWLDRIGEIFNVIREVGENDTNYRLRIELVIQAQDSGTPEFVIRKAEELSGVHNVKYLDEAPATFFVYTHANQLRPNVVKKLSPAGVLGLSGSAIMTATGLILGMVSTEQRLISAAYTENPTNGMLIITEDEASLLTENNDNLICEESFEGENQEILID